MFPCCPAAVRARIPVGEGSHWPITQRYHDGRSIDIAYLRVLSADAVPADAVPALDTRPEPLRSCALRDIERSLRSSDTPWYAMSLGEARAREILRERGTDGSEGSCSLVRGGVGGGEGGGANGNRGHEDGRYVLSDTSDTSDVGDPR
ncbi:hypothetical protein ACFYXM_25290 [Streptomyces sp. NPDC002476]|uniref:hypothetical protein n=1 Tax=Streptomyces sp. NPDC002476 TaxID=3364648 RepID=UPI00368D68B2